MWAPICWHSFGKDLLRSDMSIRWKNQTALQVFAALLIFQFPNFEAIYIFLDILFCLCRNCRLQRLYLAFWLLLFQFVDWLKVLNFFTILAHFFQYLIRNELDDFLKVQLELSCQTRKIITATYNLFFEEIAQGATIEQLKYITDLLPNRGIQEIDGLQIEVIFKRQV